MTRYFTPIVAAVGLIFILQVLAQADRDAQTGDDAGRVASEVSSQLAEENDYFRVFRMEFPRGAASRVDHHDRDTVLLALDVGLILRFKKLGDAEILPKGTVRFVKREDTLEIGNKEDEGARVLLVELKRHWDVDVRPCAEPSKCTRPISMGGASIGESTSLFTNGFITAYQHRLDASGTLTSSYFSANGKDHLLLIALTDLQASFDGTDATLLVGETYASEAVEVEVNAPKSEARWIVIRMQTPKA